MGFDAAKSILGIEFGSTRIKAVLIDENNAPIASGSVVSCSTCESLLILLLIMEYEVIESTVQPERKLITDTLSTPNASSTGLIITPPPIPHIAPTIEARKHIIKNIIGILLRCPFFSYFKTSASYLPT